MPLILCPGFHDSRLNDRLLASFPVDLVLSPFSSIDTSLVQGEPLTLIAFSAGVVTAMANATLWKAIGGEVKALFALDGWGVPLAGDFPIYRLSHDYFTHWSSRPLGGGAESFYADPPVDHLTLWASPDRVIGREIVRERTRSTDALTFLSSRLTEMGLGIIN